MFIRAVFIIALAAAAPVALAQSADEKQMLENAARAYRQSRSAITSIELEMEQSLNGGRSRARIARKGEKIHVTSIHYRGDGRPVLPQESAWDGKLVHERSRDALSSSSTRAWNPAFYAPDEQIAQNYVDAALLGAKPVFRMDMVFKSARQLEFDDHACIELTWDATWEGMLKTYKMTDIPGVLTIVLDTEQGYWPVSVRRVANAGQLASGNFDFRRIEYASVDTPTGKVFYPVLIEQVQGEGLPPKGNLQINTVVMDSLKINQPLDDARFVLKPFPNQQWVDPEGKSTPPADPNWTPMEKDLFAWSEISEVIERERKPYEEQKAREEKITADALATATTDAERSRALAELAAMKHVTTMDRAMPWIAPVGIGVTLVAGFFVYRNRQRSA